MNVRYRVTAKPPEGEGIIYELFEAESDARRYYEELQAEDTILKSTGYDCVVIELSEFVNGVWTTANRRVVTELGD